MISETASRCLSLISALELVQHRKPPKVQDDGWCEAVRELAHHVLLLDEQREYGLLELLLAGLKEEWQCHLSERAALQMGLATRALLDAV